MSEEKAWIICSPGELDHFPYPTVEVECHVCRKRLQMDAKNKPVCDRENILPICVECFMQEGPKQPEGTEIAGALIFGKKIDKPADALKALAKGLGPRRNG